MPRSAEPLFAWRAPEYHINEKSPDWFWALGILAFAIAVAAILFGNVLLAVVVICAAGSIALVAKRKPKEHFFAITEEGIVVDNDLWPYDSVISFSMIEYLDETLPPFLSVKTRSILVPHFSIPVQGVDADEVYEFLSNNLAEEDHKMTASEYIIELFRI